MPGRVGFKFTKMLGTLFGLSLFKKNMRSIGVFLFVSYIGYLGWMYLGPQKITPSYSRQHVADIAVKKMTEDIRSNRGLIRRVALLHFYNDPTDYVSDALRNSLNSSGVLNLSDVPLMEKIYKRLQLKCSEYNSSREAQKAIAGEDVEAVLWGRVDVFESNSSGAVIKCEWFLDEKKSGHRVASGIVMEDSTTPFKKVLSQAVTGVRNVNPDLEGVSSLLPWYIRFLGFTLLVLLLPVVTISFIRTMVSKDSNKVNAFLLALYTVIDAILAFFMVGGVFSDFWTVLFFFIAAGLAFCYNVQIMSFALRLEKN